jgi:hypothetical protein
MGAKHDSCRFDTCRCPPLVRLSTTHTDKTKAPRKPRRCRTSIVRLSRGDLGRLALKDLLGGRYGNRSGLHRLWDHLQEVDLQKPVLQARALDLDMVGELEAAFNIPLGNALVDQAVALLVTAALLVAADR